MAQKLSVILCINKPNPWWQEAFDSVLAQSDPEFEFLVAANACSDEFWECLQDKAKGDPRIKLFRTKIGQLAFNLNFLADKAGGDYLVRMDADDVCEPHRIATLRRALQDIDVDILGSSVTLIDEDGVAVGFMDFPCSQEGIKLALRSRTAFCHPAVTFRRQFLLDMRGYLGGFVSEDTDLWLRALRAGAKMKNLPEHLLRYRIHKNQSINSCQGYAEVASHWLREMLLSPSLYTFTGFLIALTKALCAPMLPGVRRYRTSNPQMTE